MSAKTAGQPPHRPNVSQEEWDLRVELASCYRVVDEMGWSELIFNHISLRLPGPEHHFLINPYGLWYREVKASNLVKIDLEGKIVGPADYPFNPAGFPLHSAIHAARPDAKCVMHTHTTAGIAIACLEEGLNHDNFYSSQIFGEVAYHNFEGVTVDTGEMPRMVASLGTKNHLILRNHGLVTMGGNVAECFMRHWNLQRACEIQLQYMQTGRPIRPVDRAVHERNAQATQAFAKLGGARTPFAALVRRVEARDASFRE
ncbi:MAG: class II aldolase/adducin family protein [Alphaproteobacteria bacterium]|nr:class II aldolase/adducin family protein [Alphaproteobacteria bacterium]